MFLPSDLAARSPDATPPPCKPFTIHSNVCVGDMIAIIACSVAGIGFFFWAIHAVRKMRNDPFNDLHEDEEDPKGESNGVEPFHVPSADDARGGARKLTPPERVRTRLALSQPEEPWLSSPVQYDPYKGQGTMAAPRMPSRAGGQPQRTSSHSASRRGSLTRLGPYGQGYEYAVNGDYMKRAASRSPSRHESLTQGGPYAERYEYRVNDEHMQRGGRPSGEEYEHRMDGEYMKRATSRKSKRHESLTRGPYGRGYEYDEYMTNAYPSQAKVSPARGSSGDYESRQSTKCINGDHVY